MSIPSHAAGKSHIHMFPIEDRKSAETNSLEDRTETLSPTVSLRRVLELDGNRDIFNQFSNTPNTGIMLGKKKKVSLDESLGNRKPTRAGWVEGRCRPLSLEVGDESNGIADREDGYHITSFLLFRVGHAI